MSGNPSQGLGLGFRDWYWKPAGFRLGFPGVGVWVASLNPKGNPYPSSRKPVPQIKYNMNIHFGKRKHSKLLDNGSSTYTENCTVPNLKQISVNKGKKNRDRNQES